jgi:quinol monooxygenase YgiN
VTQRQARSGQEAALVEAASRLFGEVGTWSPARLRLRLFQGRDRPGVLLILSDWQSREATSKYLQRIDHLPQLDRYCSGVAERGFFHQLSGHDGISGRAVAATCTLVQCPRAAMPAVLSFLLEVSGPTLRAQPGLVVRDLYQNADKPNCFLAVRGWDSLAAPDDSYSTLAPRLDAQLRERGAEVSHFRGRTRADITR